MGLFLIINSLSNCHLVISLQYMWVSISGTTLTSLLMIHEPLSLNCNNHVSFFQPLNSFFYYQASFCYPRTLTSHQYEIAIDMYRPQTRPIHYTLAWGPRTVRVRWMKRLLNRTLICFYASAGDSYRGNEASWFVLCLSSRQSCMQAVKRPVVLYALSRDSHASGVLFALCLTSRQSDR